MEKVFCKNCKYDKGYSWHSCKKKLKLAENSYNPFTNEERPPENHYKPEWKSELNKTGDCPHFEIKWWRKLYKLGSKNLANNG